MNSRIVFSIFIVMFLSGCQSETGNLNDAVKSKGDSIIMMDNGNVQPAPAQSKPPNGTYIFGMFCGMCNQHCADMYRYVVSDSGCTLDMDPSDDFFEKEGNRTYPVKISDPASIKIANYICCNIPSVFTLKYNEVQRYGCPDCSDGCGLYLKIDKARTKYVNCIDTDTSQIPADIRTYVDSLRDGISLLHHWKKI